MCPEPVDTPVARLQEADKQIRIAGERLPDGSRIGRELTDIRTDIARVLDMMDGSGPSDVDRRSRGPSTKDGKSPSPSQGDGRGQ